MFDLLHEIVQTLSNNKLRTTLTGFAVAWGIFMLIVLLGMSRGVYNSFNAGFVSQGANTMQIWSGITSMPYDGLKEGRFVPRKEDDMSVIKSQNANGVESVTAEISGIANVSTTRDYISNGYLGVFPDKAVERAIDVSYGRFINSNDMELRRKVMVINRKNAELLFGKVDDVLGRQVECKGLSFTIVGVYEHDWDDTNYIPYSTAQMLNAYKNEVNSITVSTKNITTLDEGEAFEQEIRKTLGRKNRFNPEDPSAVWIWNKFTNYMKMNAGLSMLNMAVWVIGFFTMLTGIVGVSNIMFVSVKERTHEIGIRRAIGAKPRSILLQVILESVSITTLFGYMGIFMGICATELLAKVFATVDFVKDPTVDISIAVQVTIVLIVAGAIAGIFPAMKALKVRPVEALRTE